MTNAAESNSERNLCHDPYGGATTHPLVGDAAAVSNTLQKKFS
jgi:hypothetical protein